MSLFEKRFKLLLEEPTEAARGFITLEEPQTSEVPVSDSPVDDHGLTPDADTISAVDDVPTNPGLSYKKELTSAQTAELQSWIAEIEGFKNYLNGTDNDSLQKKINGAECDTLFNEISRSETKKISRIAQDLSALVESLKGYLLAHEDE